MLIKELLRISLPFWSWMAFSGVVPLVGPVNVNGQLNENEGFWLVPLFMVIFERVTLAVPAPVKELIPSPLSSRFTFEFAEFPSPKFMEHPVSIVISPFNFSKWVLPPPAAELMRSCPLL